MGENHKEPDWDRIAQLWMSCDFYGTAHKHAKSAEQ